MMVLNQFNMFNDTHFHATTTEPLDIKYGEPPVYTVNFEKHWSVDGAWNRPPESTISRGLVHHFTSNVWR